MTQSSKQNEDAVRAASDVANAVAEILNADTDMSAYLYGSAATGDYRRGWSDIDVLILTTHKLTLDKANELVELRQRMVNATGNAIYRTVEGAIVDADAFVHGACSRIVYWGTSGERITDAYRLNSLSMLDLIDNGVMIKSGGVDIKECIRRPAYDELYADIKRHSESVRMYAHTTGRSLYSFGWLFDIARCIYTLRTGKIIPKTCAGEWALEEGICPCQKALEFALRVRREPEAYLRDVETLDYASKIGGDVLSFADVLDVELAKYAT